MSYQGDIAVSQILYFNFTTVDNTGLPTVLTGTPALSVYKDDNTTESTAGVTLSASIDSRTGLNNVKIDTSADGTFYAAGHDFTVVITAGTVGGVSVVGYEVGSFSINNRSALRPATAGRTLVVDAAGLADANMVKAGPSGSGATITARDIGYSVNGYDGGWVWFDTAGAAGTTSYVNGTVLNPNSSMANSRTIANALNLKGFRIVNGSTVTLDQGYNGFTFFGYKWTLALANRAIDNSYFKGAASVTGLSSGTAYRFEDCGIGNVTVDPGTFTGCALNGTVTIGTAGTFTFDQCYSEAAAGGDTNIDFGAAVGATNIAFRHFAGSLAVANMKAGDVLVFAGTGKLTLAASCTAGTVYIRGLIELVNNGSGQTITDTSRYNEDQNVTNVTGNVAGSVGSVTGAVGSVTGNVGGNVVGTVASVVGNVGGNVTGSVGSVAAGGIAAASFAAGAIDATAIANGAIDAATFAAGAIDATAIANGAIDAATFAAGAIDATAIANGAIDAATFAAGAIDAAAIATGAIDADALATDAVNEIADGVWNEAIAGHLGAGSTGAALNAAGSAGDPWTTLIPGAYGVGTAGHRLGNIPDVAAGVAGGVFIAGANAATSVDITGNITGNLSGSVGSVTGAVGSVTGNVGGNVTGSVGSVVGAVGSVTGNVGGNVTGSVGSVVGAVGSVTGNVGGNLVGNVNGNVVGSVGSVMAGVTVTTNNDKSGYALTAAGNNAAADALLDRANAIETGITLRQAERVILSATAGKSDGFPGNPVHYRDTSDTKDRITATTDADGNRTAVTLDVS